MAPRVHSRRAISAPTLPTAQAETSTSTPSNLAVGTTLAQTAASSVASSTSRRGRGQAQGLGVQKATHDGHRNLVRTRAEHGHPKRIDLFKDCHFISPKGPSEEGRCISPQDVEVHVPNGVVSALISDEICDQVLGTRSGYTCSLEKGYMTPSSSASVQALRAELGGARAEVEAYAREAREATQRAESLFQQFTDFEAWIQSFLVPLLPPGIPLPPGLTKSGSSAPPASHSSPPVWSKEVCDGTSDPALEATCGRPLGLEFNYQTGDLYVADAYFGLLVVGPNGGNATQLATTAEIVPFRFLDGLDIDQGTGIVYFTDASARFQRSQTNEAILSRDMTGRLLKYDPRSKKVTVLLSQLAGAGGVAVSKNGTFVLVTELIASRIQRFWIKGPKANTSEILIKLPPPPDNINRNEKGEFWVATNLGYEGGRKQAYSDSSIREELLSQPMPLAVPLGQRISEEGKVLEAFSIMRHCLWGL